MDRVKELMKAGPEEALGLAKQNNLGRQNLKIGKLTNYKYFNDYEQEMDSGMSFHGWNCWQRDNQSYNGNPEIAINQRKQKQMEIKPRTLLGQHGGSAQTPGRRRMLSGMV